MSVDLKIESLLKKMCNDDIDNLKVLNNFLHEENITSEHLVEAILDEEYVGSRALKAIFVLFENKLLDVNYVNDFKYNFIQVAVYTGYSENFVCKLLGMLSKSEDFNVNHVDEDGDTMVHSAIYADNFSGDIAKIFKFMLTKGFDYTIKDKSGRNMVDAMKYEQERINKFSDEEIEEVEYLLSKFEETKGIREEVKNNENSFSQKVEKLLDALGADVFDNYKIIEQFCKKEFVKIQDFLYCLSTHLYDESKCMLVVEMLLDMNCNVEYTPNNGMNSFFQNLVENNYSPKFILGLLEYVVNVRNKSVNLNYRNQSGEDLVDTVIKNKNYKVNADELRKTLSRYGYDESKVFINNSMDNKVEDRVYFGVEDSIDDTDTLENVLDEEDIKALEKYGVILNKKSHVVEPVVGRERELKNLMVTLAQEKKCPIIVGESGVGKTALVEELAYKVNKGEVPKFLKNKIVYEINPNELVSGCRYVGDFEEKMKVVFDLSMKHDVILFIDEIHTIYGVGTTEDKSVGMESMIKHFIDRSNIKVVGTTTEEEYQKYFAMDALKRRFEKIVVKEPEEDVLERILDKVIDGYCLKNSLFFKEDSAKKNVIKAIMYATDKSHRTYNDKVNNPDLSISIIDKAFAFAKYNDCKYIDEGSFIEAFEYCDRIYSSACENAVKMLKKPVKPTVKEGAKVINIDFSSICRR